LVITCRYLLEVTFLVEVLLNFLPIATDRTFLYPQLIEFKPIEYHSACEARCLAFKLELRRVPLEEACLSIFALFG